MAYKILMEECCSCGACVSQCPVEAITMPGWPVYAIDAERCNDCFEYGRPVCQVLPRGPGLHCACIAEHQNIWFVR